MKRLSANNWFLFVVMAFCLAACESLNVVQTSEDGQEIRFDTVKGSIEYTQAMITGAAESVLKARDNQIMSEATALKIKAELSDAQDKLDIAQSLANELRLDEAETKVKASKAALNIARKLINNSNIGDTQL